MADLTGRIAEVLFETGYHFKLEYLDANQMRYTSLREEDQGKTEVVKIELQDQKSGMISVSWVEATGTTVTHIINLNHGQVYAFMTWPDSVEYGDRATMAHKGTFKLIDDKVDVITNKELVLTFWQEFFNGKDLSAVDRYISEDEYIQHNPGVLDGREIFKEVFGGLFQGDLKNAEFKVVHVVAEDDLVGIHNLVTVSDEDPGTVGFDLFRVKEGKIVEHWDVLQPMPTDAPNPKAMF